VQSFDDAVLKRLGRDHDGASARRALEQAMTLFPSVSADLIFGVLGYFMRRYGFSVVPLAIGLILGGMLEQRFGQSMVMLDEKWWLIASRPLALFFLILTALALFGPLVWSRIAAKRNPSNHY
jgi:putative tricarboxylic transport membrane protein